jgi:hypothetical protein
MMNRMQKIGDRVGNKLNQQVNKAGDKINQGIQKAGHEIHQGVTTAGNAINKGTQVAVKAVQTGTQKAISGVQTATQKVITGVGQGVHAVGSTIGGPVGTAINKVNTTVTTGLTKANTATATALTKANTTTAQVMNTVNNTALKGFEAVNNTTYKGLQAVQTTAAKGIQMTTEGLYQGTKIVSHGLVQGTIKAVDGIKDLGEKGINKARNIGQDAIQGARGVINKVGDFTKDTAHTVGHGIKDKAINIYQGSKVMQNLVDDAKSLYYDSRGTIEAWQRGDFVGGIKHSANVFYSTADLVSGGNVKVAKDFGVNMAKSFKAAGEGNWTQAFLSGEAMVLDGVSLGVGPGFNMIIGPKNVDDLNNAAVGMAMKAKDVGVAIGKQATNLFGHGEFKSSDFQNVVDAGAGFQNSVLNLAATGFTNLDLGRDLINDVGGSFNKGTQSLGNAAVGVTRSVEQFSQGNYVDALKTGGNAALDATEGLGKVGGTVMTGVQTVAGFIPAAGQAVQIPLALAGAGFQIAGNIKAIGGGYVNGGISQIEGMKNIFGGDVEKGFKQVGMAMAHGALATTLAGTEAMSGGLGGIAGKFGGKAVGMLAGKGVSALTKVASKAMAKGASKIVKVANVGAKVLTKVQNKAETYVPKVVTQGNKILKKTSDKGVTYLNNKQSSSRGATAPPAPVLSSQLYGILS